MSSDILMSGILSCYYQNFPDLEFTTALLSFPCSKPINNERVTILWSTDTEA